MTPEALARTLTAERKKRGFTQSQVAEYIGCHISQVQAFEYRPQTNRKLQTYLDYAQGIGLELDLTLKDPNE
jgi:transcriptional regulator with XRE-family HTH domain